MRRAVPDKRMTAAEGERQLLAKLWGCTPAALAVFTAEGLAGSHRVDRKTAEYHLTVVRQKRAAA